MYLTAYAKMCFILPILSGRVNHRHTADIQPSGSAQYPDDLLLELMARFRSQIAVSNHSYMVAEEILEDLSVE